MLELWRDLMYINGDTGYLVLTCGRCEESVHHIDAGDSLSTLTIAATQHRCKDLAMAKCVHGVNLNSDCAQCDKASGGLSDD